MANLFYRTFGEMYDAGYAVMEYSITNDRRHWRYREESFTTEGTPQFVVHGNNQPDIKLAAITDIRKHAIG